MDHPEVEELLGAYALDALDPSEASEVELHLRDCPRCRAEVAAHREVASLLGAAGTNAPDAIWERINSEIREPVAPAPELGRILALDGRTTRRRRVSWAVPIASVAAAVVAGLVGLSLEVGHLNNQVHSFQAATANSGLAPLVAAALVQPSGVVHLTARVSGEGATVARTASGLSYWAGSEGLAALPSDETYQLWGIVKGRSQPVSLALLGADPDAYSAFRMSPNIGQLMVTVEPAGGVAAPTTPVIVQGLVE